MRQRRYLQRSVTAALSGALLLIALGGCSDPVAKTLGGNRVFTYREQFYAVRCEVVRDDVLGPPLTKVQFEDGSLNLRTVKGVDPGKAVAAEWSECAAASEPAPWILAVAGPESGAVDYKPYGQYLEQPAP